MAKLDFLRESSKSENRDIALREKEKFCDENRGGFQAHLLDTLAQLATDEKKTPLTPITKKADKPALVKRARVKYLTTAIVLRLVDLDSSLRKNYWNTFHCSSVLSSSENGKIVGRFCKNRWCLVCNRIRTAELVNKYHAILSQWEDKHFVTLTVPNVSAELLSETIDIMQFQFLKVRKLASRRKIFFVGLRKLECTYNPARNDYHPHYHVVVSGKIAADFLLEQWLLRFPNAVRSAQDVRPCDDNHVFELFKYFTKIISSTSKTSPNPANRSIYVTALDVVFQAVVGRRTFQPFGFTLPKLVAEDQELEVLAEKIGSEGVYRWVQELSDWVDFDTGELLTGYVPSDGLKNVIGRII